MCETHGNDRRRLCCCAAAVLCASAIAAKTAFADRSTDETPPVPGSFAELLDPRWLPARKHWRTRQASGYDRDGGFYDSGNFLRIEDGDRYVLMEAHGPGCIDRMWFTYKKPIGAEPYNLLVYIDDPAIPVIDIDLDEFFSGRHPPFVPPLSGLCGLPKQPGRFSYVPIPFVRYCKVLLQPSAPKDQYNYRTNSAHQTIPHIYYQITYREFASPAGLRPFTWRLTKPEQSAFEQTAEMHRAAARSPWSRLTTSQRLSGTATLTQNQQVDLLTEHCRGVIHEIRLRLDNPQQVRLQASWDAAAKPQICVPLGPFFACDEHTPPPQDVRGLWTGYEKGWYYCYLPMPFQTQARISLISQSEQPRKVDYQISYSGLTLTQDQGWLCAHRYDHNPPPKGEPYEVLDVEGAGHLVAIIMDRPGHMEGDDRFYIDGEKTPSMHGTGTEDFFNFAWGLSHTGSLPLHGITIQNNRPIAYRFHVPAAVPFSTSLRITWEHGHDPLTGPNLDQNHYSGLALYYLMPKPPDR